MKKLLALLLALLMPVCAAAETYSLSVSVDLDEQLFSWYAKQAIQSDPEFASYNADALADTVIKIVNGFGVDMTAQADAMALKVNLAGGELLNAAIHMAEDAVYVSSPMLSGYALKADTQATTGAEQSLSDMFAGSDWSNACASMQTALENWLAQITPTTSRGVYSGDAYTGGTQCTTWILTDMDIAALVSALATDELRSMMSMLLNDLGLEADEAFAHFDAANDRVADADVFIYMLRVVTDDAGDFVGASLTVLEDQVQVATVSLGLDEKTVKVVVGLGLSEQNYWWEFTGKKSQLKNITYLSGNSREWIAQKSESFSYVSATNAPLSNYMLRCTLTKSGNRYLWDGNISLGEEPTYEYVCSSSGTYIPTNGTLDCSICLGGAPYEPLRLNIKFGPAEKLAPLDSALAVCSVSDPADAALLQELMEKFSASIVARMIKLLPMDLIMTLNQFTLP